MVLQSVTRLAEDELPNYIANLCKPSIDRITLLRVIPSLTHTDTILTEVLTYHLEVCTACIYMYIYIHICVCVYLSNSDIPFGIVPGIYSLTFFLAYSEILFGILSGILFGTSAAGGVRECWSEGVSEGVAPLFKSGDPHITSGEPTPTVQTKKHPSTARRTRPFSWVTLKTFNNSSIQAGQGRSKHDMLKLSTH